MRTGAVLTALAAAPIVDLATLCGDGGIVVVAPHPDDESLGCGGLIAQARHLDRAVRIVVLSDGCGSHPRSRLYPPPALRDLREAETRQAVGELGLGLEHVCFLRLPDAAVPSAGPIAEAAAEAVVAAAQECRASAVLTTWEHDPHCDHAAGAAIVDLARPRLAGVRLLRYPVWGWTLPPDADIPAQPEALRLDITGERATKRRAVIAHASQTTGLIDDDPDAFRLAPEMIDRMCGRYEHYLRSGP